MCGDVVKKFFMQRLNKLFNTMRTIILLISIMLIECVLLNECELSINNQDKPEACFSFTFNGEEIWDSYVEFTNCSENATSYLWDFGDTTTSNEVDPVHHYSSNGN